MANRLIIHGPNIHGGGGKTLLSALLSAVRPPLNTVAQVDRRMVLPSGMAAGIEVRRVPPTVAGRFLAEKWLRSNARAEDVVLCFGNLPPLFALRCPVVVFVQNRYLVEAVGLGRLSFTTRLRLQLERLWFKSKLANADLYVVQTASMKRLLEQKTRGRVPVEVIPFGAEKVPSDVLAMPVSQPPADFVYVASGEAHKNHGRLLEAWRLLAEEGLFPTLRLTVDDVAFPRLCRELRDLSTRHGLQISNIGAVPLSDTDNLYVGARALIYPSLLESFGLPLIEAKQRDLPIVAAELDYVRDVATPQQTFDPTSAVSIARAVKRFLAVSDLTTPLQTPEAFLRNILETAKR
jgi:glycosyltransferase involved in cell wall biosynthesis